MKSSIIYLVGFMGAGKTTLGKKLAEAIRYTFIDLDSYLEEEFSCTIETLLAPPFKEYFRSLEYGCLKKVTLTHENLVVACGGGVVTYPRSLQLLCQRGYPIYLKTPVETLYERLRKDPGNRPLLKNCTTDSALKERIQSLFEGRRALYESIPQAIDATGSLEQSLQRALELVSKELKFSRRL